MISSNYIEQLPQYHFDREDFVRIWNEVFGEDTLIPVDLCNECTSTEHFKLWHDEFEEYYIQYIPTGVIINWYKGSHLGRTNTCTDPNFTLDDFREFLKLLKADIEKENDNG